MTKQIIIECQRYYTSLVIGDKGMNKIGKTCLHGTYILVERERDQLVEDQVEVSALEEIKPGMGR